MMKGSCHCGDVTFEVDAEIEGPVIECNCSHCRRKGYLLWFQPRHKLKHATPEHHLATYTFNKHVIQHHFCLRCGCAPFGEGVDPKGNPTAAINVRCLEGVDLTKIERMPFDGASK
ncbi:MAG: GFA family protein [Rhodospirillaceae bacterium]|nr:GFA family protein [Rhodospirillaceae bacterium]